MLKRPSQSKQCEVFADTSDWMQSQGAPPLREAGTSKTPMLQVLLCGITDLGS